jgi:transmembrane sensor
MVFETTNFSAMKDDLFEDILKKFLKGEATGHEKRMLSSRLKEDSVLEEVFYYHLSKRETENPQHLPEVDSRFQAYEKYLQEGIQIRAADRRHSQGAISMRARSKNCLLLWAASVLVLISAGVFVLIDSFLYRTYSSGKGSISSVTLEDGSKVTLNANSSIRVLHDFMDHSNREVWIEGEAFFEVIKRNDHKKFIVHTDNFDVEVLGTKFNVNNRHCKTEVMLTEGKVKLVAKDHAPVIMKPGEQVSRSNSNSLFKKRLVEPEKYTAWRNNILVFENTPLTEVTGIISDYYDLEMTIADSLLGTRQFTGSLPNNDLDLILLALSTSYRIEIERRGDRIILRNKIPN